MDKSKIVFHSIALMTLVVVCLCFWDLIENTHTEISQQPTTDSRQPTADRHLYLLLSISLLAILLGVACAFYLEERLSSTSWIRCLIESEVAIFTGIPSLLYALLALELFVSYTLGGSGQGGGMLFYAEVLTFILLVMPLTIRTTQAALRSVARPIRESAYALGASQWQVLCNQVVPLAFSGILAGSCRAMSRALAAAALLIGIHTSGYTHETTISAGIHSRYVLLLVTALLFSALFSFLKEHTT